MSKGLKAVLALTLVAITVAGYFIFATASVTIQTQPTGAEVQINGERVGATPITRHRLAAGRHKIAIAHSHYAPLTEQLDIALGDHLQRSYTMQAGQGTLELLSNPKGAWVEVNQERLASTTPTQIDLASGKHRIRMGKSERRVSTKDIVLKANETQQVNLNLQIDPHGSLTLKLQPSDAKVDIVDSNVAYQPGMRLPMGEYAIAVSRPGYVTERKRIKIRYGDNVERVVLGRAYGRLTVVTEPVDAVIDVSLPGSSGIAYTPNMRLPTGRLTLSVRAMGHRTSTRQVNLTTQGNEVSVRLQKMSATPGTLITDSLQSGGLAPPMIVVPPGQFKMGDANGGSAENPVRTVQLTQPFAVGTHEVSVEEFSKYTRATAAVVNEKLQAALAQNAITKQSPVVYVSHQQAKAYAAWLSKQTGAAYRLPTEAEWEYFARAGSAAAYSHGNDATQLCQYANVADTTLKKRYRNWTIVDCDDGQERPTLRGQYRPNAFGLYDIHGNVSEWVADCGMPNYAKASRDGTKQGQGQSCSSHGHRGGSWDSGPDAVKLGYRKTASRGSGDRGIRLVREL